MKVRGGWSSRDTLLIYSMMMRGASRVPPLHRGGGMWRLGHSWIRNWEDGRTGRSLLFLPQSTLSSFPHTLKRAGEWEESQKEGGDGKEKDNKKGRPLLAQYLRWTPVPFFALLTYHQYRRLGQVEEVEESLKDWQITCYRMLPWKAVSKAWGWINDVELPLWARTPFLSFYANTFGCDLCEAQCDDLCQYKNLGEFFRRSLKEGARIVDFPSPLVSPVDGTVLNFGKVEGGVIEQVKGVAYSLPQFLGPPTWIQNGDSQGPGNYSLNLLKDKEKHCLYHCVIYLAPGDYHRFHSPADWTIHFRRHFAGELLSVNPRVAHWISGLFSLNERAVYVGQWEHGFFSMTAVGATNVGSIRVYQDQQLVTNSWKVKKNSFVDKSFKNDASEIVLKKGDPFGEFNLGSTIVLVFEAPHNFNFNLEVGDKIRMGKGIFPPLSS